jgi:hypothetical protein
VGPWDPNWRPDPTGQRLAGIRAARRGALASTVIFGPLVLLATLAAPLASTRSQPLLEDWLRDININNADTIARVAIALISLPGLALLGAGLTSAALGSRTNAATAGLAMGVGVPVASVTSALIGAFFLGEMAVGPGQGSVLAGDLLRAGVTAAVRISPLIVLGSVAWVLAVRRFGQPAASTLEDRTLRPGRGPRRRRG